MSETYSTYEAKSRLSEILRKVERGRTVGITRRGKLIAEITPVRPGAASLEQRIAELVEQGALLPATTPEAPLEPVAKRPGALARFLVDRNG